jgi:uncharacterized integral membrane protein
VSAFGPGLSPGAGVTPTRIPRSRAGFIRVSAGVGVLALAAALVFVASNTGSSRAWSAPLHDRRPVTVILLVVAAVGWEFTVTLAAVRVVQLRQIMRRHRLEQLATTLSATGPDLPGFSLDKPHPHEQAREE